MWYSVQPGDTLYGISHRFAVPLQVLVQTNSIYNGILYIGQRLYIPLAARNITPSTREVKQYTVVAGDTLESIAQQFNTTKQAIMQLNNLKDDLIVPG